MAECPKNPHHLLMNNGTGRRFILTTDIRRQIKSEMVAMDMSIVHMEAERGTMPIIPEFRKILKGSKLEYSGMPEFAHYRNRILSTNFIDNKIQVLRN